MVRIIVSVVLLVLLAILVALNVGFTTTVSLFGFRLENVSIVSVGILCFALGVLYSVFLYFGRYLHGRARDKLARKDRQIAEREKELSVRQTEAESASATEELKDSPG
jgi:uncharacterized integral membrane protein